MKKIFLPLLALCGMVAGLTLTSCGGGGGGNPFAGKVYEFYSYSTSSMSMTCDEAGIQNNFTATLSWDGSNTGSAEVIFEEVENDNGEKGYLLHFYGIEADIISDARVQTFFGLATPDANVDATQSIGFSIYLERLPKKLGELSGTGSYLEAVYVDFNENGQEDEGEDLTEPNPDDPNPDDPDPNKTRVPLQCKRVR